MPLRQSARKQVTESPRVTTLSTVKSKKSTEEEPMKITQTTATDDSLVGVQDDESSKLAVNKKLIGVPHSATSTTTTEIPTTPTNSCAPTSLSNVREITQGANTDIDTEFGPEDNSMLVPIGGQAVCEDIAPTESRLGQLEVDSEIARMIALEEHTNLEKSDPCNLGVPLDSPEAQPVEDPTPMQVSDVIQSSVSAPSGNKGARPKTGTKEQSEHTTGRKGSRGAFKSQLYGLRRSHPKDRSYKCQVCGKSKRSMESLNEHHRRNHNPQMCGVCGKMFDLATTLAHHMYSHYTHKHYCDKCDFHCYFKSELESHKIVHRDQPSFQCMYPKCGRWFKRKGELSLHVEIHNKIWYDCKKCDFSTKLQKYLKEHEKKPLKKE